ncbi:hypothetical protein [Sulfurovum sp. AR]|uniref:hypothetical protein n=1 Tax=Sulfurovum sp. AR TaxID=1165841 RepID=UPI00025C47BC|nr:hypothetical protein [Sulfurovum sp. AR]EIF51220.1 hypothetical protein SULAR_04998 [Sulfurovum sp. AR]
MSREKTIYTTIIFNFFVQIVNFAYKFLLTPFLLDAWGDLKYGEWLTLFSFITSISLLNFGIAKFYGNNLRVAYIEQNWLSYKKIFSEALWVSIAIFLIASGILVVIVNYMSITTILNLSHWPKEEIQLSIILLGMSIVGMILLELASSLYVSVGKYSYKPLFDMINLIVQILLIIFFLSKGAGIVEVSAIILFSVLAITVIIIIMFVRLHKKLISVDFPNRFKDLKTNIAISSNFQLITLSQFFILQGSVLLISNQIGASFVALFVITRTVTSSLGRQVTQIIYNGIWPELTTLYAERNFNKIQNIHAMLIKFSLVASTLFSIFIILFIDNIFNLWLSTDKYLDYTLVGLFLIYLITLQTWFPSSFLLMANNEVKSLGRLSFLSAFTFLTFGFFYVEIYNLYGLLIVMIMIDLIILFTTIPYMAAKSSKDNTFMIYKNIIKSILPMIIFFIFYFLYPIENFLKDSSLISKIIYFLIFSNFLILYMWSFSFSEYEKKYIKNRIPL